MALGRERMRNSWYEWNLSNSWEDPWYEYGSSDSGDSWEDDGYTNEIRYAHWSPWNRTSVRWDDDYRYYHREGGDRNPLRGPVGAWQLSCAENHGVRAQMLRRHDKGRAGKFGGKGRLYQRRHRANKGKGAMTFPTVTPQGSQASSSVASTSDVASQLDSLRARMGPHRSRHSLQARMNQLQARMDFGADLALQQAQRRGPQRLARAVRD